MKNKRKILVTTFLIIASLGILIPIILDPIARLFFFH